MNDAPSTRSNRWAQHTKQQVQVRTMHQSNEKLQKEHTKR
jgi:hypothetical protein